MHSPNKQIIEISGKNEFKAGDLDVCMGTRFSLLASKNNWFIDNEEYKNTEKFIVILSQLMKQQL